MTDQSSSPGSATAMVDKIADIGRAAMIEYERPRSPQESASD